MRFWENVVPLAGPEGLSYAGRRIIRLYFRTKIFAVILTEVAFGRTVTRQLWE